MFFQTPFTWKLEYWKHVFLTRRWHFSYANQSQKEKQSGNNADAVLNDFLDLKSENIYNVWCKFRWCNSNPAEHKDNDMRCPRISSRCKQESKYIIMNIWFNSASLYRVLCLEYTCTFLVGNYYLNKTKPYF